MRQRKKLAGINSTGYQIVPSAFRGPPAGADSEVASLERRAAALRAKREAWEASFEAEHGEGHRNTLTAMSNLALLLYRKGLIEEATLRMEEVLQAIVDLVPPLGMGTMVASVLPPRPAIAMIAWLVRSEAVMGGPNIAAVGGGGGVRAREHDHEANKEKQEHKRFSSRLW